MTSDQLAFEVAKLALQFAGAALIAWLAVRWALRRYKAEKVWERRLGAYSDMVVALSEMLRLNRAWYEDVITDQVRTADFEARRTERYRAAGLQLDLAVSAARLLLPESTRQILDSLEQKMSSGTNFKTYLDALEHDAEVLGDALEEIVIDGRQQLGIDNLDRGG